MLAFIFLLFYQTYKYYLMFDAVSLQCQFVLLILSIVTAFSSKSFSGKTSLPAKNSYLLTFPDDKADFSVVCLYNGLVVKALDS